MTIMLDRSHARTKSAACALAELGGGRANRRLVTVECRNAHHVGAVYSTGEDFVFVSRVSVGGPEQYAPGHRYFGGTAFETVHIEFLSELEGGDHLPGSCSCGSWRLSRARLADAVRLRESVVRVG